MTSGPRQLNQSRSRLCGGRLYSFAAALALAALVLATNLHLPHLTVAAVQTAPGSGHHAIHAAPSDATTSGESLTVGPGEVDCHALPILTRARPDGDDPPPAAAGLDDVPASPAARRLAPPAVPPLPRPPGPDRQAVFQVYRL